MEKSIITFSANEQNLQKTGGIGCYASDTVSYIEAHFALGENWSGYDSIRAVWFNDYKTISTVLDPDGVCIVPHEVLVNRGKVSVNLVGSILVSDELSDRLTTFPCEALKVSAKAKISGSETAEITPSQFEQFVAIVIAEVEKVTGMTAQAETLPAGSQATARYENGILYLGIPQGIQGERGETGADGNGIASVVYNADYTLTLVFDNGERFTTPPIRGERGPAGADGRDGTDGITPNMSIGSVETLEPTQDAYVTRRGADDNPIFDFGIPRGQNGTVPDLDLILPTDTASGDIASITDGQSVVPVKSLKVSLEPIQSGSGTPSPDNIRPISGHTEVNTQRTGVNVWDEEWEAGTISNTTGLPLPDPGNIRSVNFCSCVPNTAYYFYCGSDKPLRVHWYDEMYTYIGSEVISNAVRTTPSNAVWFKARSTTAYGDTYLNDISINYPSTDTDYHPYQGTSYTTDLGRTVYGGTLDVVSGELVVDRAKIVLDGTQSIQLTNWRASENGVGWLYPYSVTNNAIPASGTAIANIVSDKLESQSYNDLYGQNVGIGVFNGTAYGIVLWQGDTSLTTKEAINAYLAEHPITIVYELATPQTIQLTPQQVMLLHGNNNVWSDGEIEMVYNADVQLWVLKQLGTSGTRTLSMTRTLDTKSEETKTDDTKSDNIQLAED